MTTVSFLPLELRSLDKLRADLLILSVFEDERPLRGVSGLVDWRTCGMLSRFLARGHVTGTQGEIVLFPPGPKVGVGRGIILGLGPAAKYDEARYRRVVTEAADHISRLKLRSVALALPGLQRRPLDLDKASQLFADIAGATFNTLTLFATQSERREITEALRRHRGEYEVAGGALQSPQPQGGLT